MKTQTKIKNKGQIGETLTWIVATLIILVILIIFIFGSSLLAKTKVVGSFRESLTSGKSFEGADIFLKKSFFTMVSLVSTEDRVSLEKKIESLNSKGKFEGNYNETKTGIMVNYNKRK